MNEEKAVMATSKAEALEVEASSLRKESIRVMDINNTSKEKIQALFKKLSTEKLLVKQRDKQLVAAN